MLAQEWLQTREVRQRRRKTMRTPTLLSRESSFDDSYFERKGNELVVADDEIEAWELDTQDLSAFSGSDEDFDLSRLG